MSLLDSFKPKWKHSDPEVRAEAVRHLSDPALLAAVMREDPDARVRRIAMKGVGDSRIIGEMADGDADEGNRRAALELLTDWACSHGEESSCLGALASLKSERAAADVAKRAAHAAVREQALARVQEPGLLADVARRAADTLTRRLAVERVEEPEVLREVALHDVAKEAPLAVIERLSDRETLELVAEQASNRRARAAARARLEQLFGPAVASSAPVVVSTAALRHARFVQLCRSVEDAAAREEPAAASGEVEEARRTREELGQGPGEEALEERFARALQAFEKALAEEHRSREERSQEEARRAEEERAGREQAREQAAQERRLTEEAEEQERQAAEKAREEQATERARTAAALQRMEQVCGRLEQLAPTEDLKVGERALKKADQVFKELRDFAHPRRGEFVSRYDQAREKLVVRLRELRELDDWKRWSNLPRLEELCAKLEALAEAEDHKQAAKELKEAQAEWKQLPAPRDRSEALWSRFKEAGDKVYERCRVYFAGLDEERVANLGKKVALCEAVEQLADSSDWKATADRIKALQEEWKAVGPVPKQDAEAVWQRFRGACNRFFERRKGHLEERDQEKADNARRLGELCEKAESLAGSEDWAHTAEALKRLQAEWKGVGRVPRKQSDALWARFRGACDQFFERRKAHFAGLDAGREQNLAHKEELIARVEAQVGTVDRAGAAQLAGKLMAEWKAIGPVPKEKSEAVWQRFRDACNRLRDEASAPASPRPPKAGAAPKTPPQPQAQFSNRLPLEAIARRLSRREPTPPPDGPVTPQRQARTGSPAAEETRADAEPQASEAPVAPAAPAPPPEGPGAD